MAMTGQRCTVASSILEFVWELTLLDAMTLNVLFNVYVLWRQHVIFKEYTSPNRKSHVKDQPGNDVMVQGELITPHNHPSLPFQLTCIHIRLDVFTFAA